MSSDYSKVPYVARAQTIERALSSLEGWAFGPWLRFAAFDYGEQLNISLGGWKEIEGFRELPGMRDFADKLNDATQPVIAEYCQKLRQELANECVKIAGKALGQEQKQ